MFKTNPNIRWRWENKEQILLNTLVGMNRTAGEILEFCQMGTDVDDVIFAMKERYPKIEYSKLRLDIKEIIDKFLKLNILILKDCRNYGNLPLPSIPSYLDHVLSYFEGGLKAPIGVACEITGACNAKCLHCCVQATRSPIPNELTTEEWKRVIDELCDLEVFEITFTGGEPLLRPDLEELIEYSSSKGLTTTLLTNGYYLTESKLESIMSAGVKGIIVSLDGADAETHDKFRGLNGLYDHVIELIALLVERNMCVAVVTTISKMNIHQIVDIIELVEELGVPGISLANFRQSGYGKENAYLSPSLKEYTKLLTEVGVKEQKLRRLQIKYPNLPAPCFLKSIGPDRYEELKEQGKVGLCGAGIIGCAISPDGEIKPCDMSGSVALGNVREKSIKEIWSSSHVFKHLRRIRASDQVPCNRCDLSIANICPMGCKALPSQIEEAENMFNVDPLRMHCFNEYRGA